MAGLALNYYWPLQYDLGNIARVIGVLSIVVGILIFLSARNEFRTVSTPIAGHQPATNVVQSGIFKFTRNPIYVSFTLLYAGIMFWTQSAWLLLTLLFPLIVIDRLVIPREEAYMEKKFGTTYLRYKASVRRWL